MIRFSRSHVLLLASVWCVHSASGAERVWIDTDISIGSPFREVDDGYALMLALHSPELRIAGISTTYGNASLDYTDRVARGFVRRFGNGVKETSVHAGARSAYDSGKRSDATEALSSALRASSLTYIAIGPLTNLAAFLTLHPGQSSRIKRIIFIGGESPDAPIGFGVNGKFRIHDANVFKDPAAAAIVLKSQIPLLLVPIFTAGRLTINPDDLRQLRDGGPAGSFLASRSSVWLLFWRTIVGEPGGPVFDVVATIAAVKPQLLQIDARYATMQKDGRLAIARQRGQAGYRVLYCSGFRRSLKALVMRRLR